VVHLPNLIDFPRGPASDDNTRIRAACHIRSNRTAAGSGFHSYKGYAQFGFNFLDLLQLIGAERGGFKVMALESQQSRSQLFFQIADGLKRGFVYLGGDGTQHNLTSLVLSGGLRIRLS
jgi:hypothetical protein